MKFNGSFLAYPKISIFSTLTACGTLPRVGQILVDYSSRRTVDDFLYAFGMADIVAHRTSVKNGMLESSMRVGDKLYIVLTPLERTAHHIEISPERRFAADAVSIIDSIHQADNVYRYM